MTLKEIISALEYGLKIARAPISDQWFCSVSTKTMKGTIDTLNSLQAENKSLNAEINLLKAKIAVYEGWGSPQEKIKAEAYKECIER